MLLGHDDLASLYALCRIMARLPGHQYTVYMSGEVAPQGRPVPALERLAHIDARMSDEYRRGGDVPAALRDAATLAQPNSAAGLAALRRLRPDVIVSVRYRRILRDAVIKIPRLGVLNLHSGVLPDYKGVMATFWAMLRGEREIGATLHRIVDSGIDTGPILAIKRMATEFDRSYLANVLRLYAPGCDMVVGALQDLERGQRLDGRTQVPGGHYFTAPRAADVERFLGQGLILADGKELAALYPR